MKNLFKHFQNTVFQKMISGDIYFISPERHKYRLGDIAKIVKNMNSVKFNGDTVSVYDNSFGDITYYENEFYSNSHEFIILSKKKIDAYYLYSFLQMVDLESKMTGYSFKFLKKETLEDLEIILPSLEEQKKIGKYMKLMDKKIKLERIRI